MKDTRTRILDAAQELFADKGFHAVSLRQITREAKVNLAAVNYHFGNKEGLIAKVLVRLGGPINQQRLMLLDAAEKAAGDGPLPLEAVLEAVIRPAFTRQQEAPAEMAVIRRLMGRVLSELGEVLPQAMEKEFGDIRLRFLKAFSRALPELAPPNLLWRLHFCMGAMAHTMIHGRMLTEVSKGLVDVNDAEETIRQLLAFAAAGLRAAPAGNVGRGGSGGREGREGR